MSFKSSSAALPADVSSYSCSSCSCSSSSHSASASASASAFELLPIPCRQEILNFLNSKDLASVSLVSRICHTDCHRIGTIPIIEPFYELVLLSQKKNNNNGNNNKNSNDNSNKNDNDNNNGNSSENNSSNSNDNSNDNSSNNSNNNNNNNKRKFISGSVRFQKLLQKLLFNQTKLTERFARYPSVRIHRIDRCFEEEEEEEEFGQDHERLQAQTQTQTNQRTKKKMCGRYNCNNNNHGHAGVLAIVQKLTESDDRQTHWTSLDVSLPRPTVLPDATVLLGVAMLFPHLRELDLSNVNFPHWTTTTTSQAEAAARANAARKRRNFSEIFDHLPLLEKITWNHSRGVYLMGWHFPSPTKTNNSNSSNNSNNSNSSGYRLKELVLDDAEFDGRSPQWIRAVVSDDRNNNNNRSHSYAIFHSCCGEGLEGISMRNARYFLPGQQRGGQRMWNNDYHHLDGYRLHRMVATAATATSAVVAVERYTSLSAYGNSNGNGSNSMMSTSSMMSSSSSLSSWPVPQAALIKFVRTAPQSLRWFRSDLSPENMDMLRSERPGIELQPRHCNRGTKGANNGASTSGGGGSNSRLQGQDQTDMKGVLVIDHSIDHRTPVSQQFDTFYKAVKVAAGKLNPDLAKPIRTLIGLTNADYSVDFPEEDIHKKEMYSRLWLEEKKERSKDRKKYESDLKKFFAINNQQIVLLSENKIEPLRTSWITTLSFLILRGHPNILRRITELSTTRSESRLVPSYGLTTRDTCTQRRDDTRNIKDDPQQRTRYSEGDLQEEETFKTKYYKQTKPTRYSERRPPRGSIEDAYSARNKTLPTKCIPQEETFGSAEIPQEEGARTRAYRVRKNNTRPTKKDRRRQNIQNTKQPDKNVDRSENINDTYQNDVGSQQIEKKLKETQSNQGDSKPTKQEEDSRGPTIKQEDGCYWN
eukprot:jgi/Psemu1/13439/gm1.13439_g